MGFTKLDEGILFSSIMQEPPDVFKVWIALLAACKEDGIARASAVGLAGMCFLPVDTVRAALRRLESPDEDSRSLNDGGKRIRRVDGGYQIINYIKYRELSTKEAEAKRKWDARHRQDCPDLSGCIQTSSDYSASASSSGIQDGGTGEGRSYIHISRKPGQKPYLLSPTTWKIVFDAASHDIEESIRRILRAIDMVYTGDADDHIRKMAACNLAQTWEEDAEPEKFKARVDIISNKIKVNPLYGKIS